MKFAYADPPYIGQAKKHYKNQPVCKEVNHTVLLAYLCENFDGWALSCSSSSLKQILALPTCPDDVRIASWVKPFCSFKPGVNPAYAWEPVLFYGAKKRNRDEDTVRDFLSENITLQKGIHGAKPLKFCYWIFDLLGVAETDEFIDIFPGTGIFNKALSVYLHKQNYNELFFEPLPLLSSKDSGETDNPGSIKPCAESIAGMPSPGLHFA